MITFASFYWKIIYNDVRKKNAFFFSFRVYILFFTIRIEKKKVNFQVHKGPRPRFWGQKMNFLLIKKYPQKHKCTVNLWTIAPLKVQKSIWLLRNKATKFIRSIWDTLYNDLVRFQKQFCVSGYLRERKQVLKTVVLRYLLSLIFTWLQPLLLFL